MKLLACLPGGVRGALKRFKPDHNVVAAQLLGRAANATYSSSNLSVRFAVRTKKHMHDFTHEHRAVLKRRTNFQSSLATAAGLAWLASTHPELLRSSTR